MKRDKAIELVKDGFEKLESALTAGRSDELIRYLDTMSKFHNYSMRNMLLIWMQKPNATMVAGFRAWQKLGRTVKKGEKGIGIFAPMPFRKDKNSKTEGKLKDSPEKVEMMGFRVVHVFDVSQTEGDEIPQPFKITGTVGDNLQRLESVVDQAGVDLEYEAIGFAEGTSSGGRIKIEESLSDVQKLATLAHELAHERLHHGERRYETTSTIRETEAEAIAFIVCHALGIESTRQAADYIQLYNGDSETLRESLKLIQSTAAWMIEGIKEIDLADCKSMERAMSLCH